MVKISVIIPIYNCEKYLARCLDSIINQTLKEIEIICVNDGSTDGSQLLLNEYQGKDSRVIVINKENMGVSDSRNLGLKKARGEFIAFVDSDDWIDIYMLETLYEASCYSGCDLVMCGYRREFWNRTKDKVFDLPDYVEYEGLSLLKLHRQLFGPLTSELGNPETLDALGTVWAKLYKANIIKENNVQFIDLKEIGSNEDGLFNIHVFKYLNKAVFINRPFYHYWKENNQSITSQYNPHLMQQWRSLFTYMTQEVKDTLYEEALQNRRCISVLGLGLNECLISERVSLAKKIKNWKGILSQREIKEAYRQFRYNQFPIHWRIFYFFNQKGLAVPSYGMLHIINYLRKRI